MRPILILKTADLEGTRRFYASLGLDLVEERHEGGPTHHSCDFGGLLVEFYPSKAPVRPGGDSLLIVEVEDFDRFLAESAALGTPLEAVAVIDAASGTRAATARDPDGRRVRVRERASA